MKLILVFMNIMKNVKFHKTGNNCILFKIDVYFSKYDLAVEIDGKGITDRYVIAEYNRQEALEKKINCKFIRTNTSKEGCNVNYAIGRCKHLLVYVKTEN